MLHITCIGKKRIPMLTSHKDAVLHTHCKRLIQVVMEIVDWPSKCVFLQRQRFCVERGPCCSESHAETAASLHWGAEDRTESGSPLDPHWTPASYSQCFCKLKSFRQQLPQYTTKHSVVTVLFIYNVSFRHVWAVNPLHRSSLRPPSMWRSTRWSSAVF